MNNFLNYFRIITGSSDMRWFFFGGGRGVCFWTISNNGFNFAILQSVRSIEYFMDELQSQEMSLAKTVTPSVKNLPDSLSRPSAWLSSISLRSFNIVSSDMKVNLNLQLVSLWFFCSSVNLKIHQISKKGETN